MKNENLPGSIEWQNGGRWALSLHSKSHTLRLQNAHLRSAFGIVLHFQLEQCFLYHIPADFDCQPRGWTNKRNSRHFGKQAVPPSSYNAILACVFSACLSSHVSQKWQVCAQKARHCTSRLSSACHLNKWPIENSLIVFKKHLTGKLTWYAGMWTNTFGECFRPLVYFTALWKASSFTQQLHCHSRLCLLCMFECTCVAKAAHLRTEGTPLYE